MDSLEVDSLEVDTQVVARNLEANTPAVGSRVRGRPDRDPAAAGSRGEDSPGAGNQAVDIPGLQVPHPAVVGSRGANRTWAAGRE